MTIPILLLILGLAILIAGGESLVRGASSIALKFKIQPIVIGLTIVAFGTSAPELVVNILSAINGNSDLAFGNIIGSNISNILLILGISAIFTPLAVQYNTTWKEIPFAILAIVAVYFMSNDVLFDNAQSNSLSRTDGILLLLLFVIFLYYTVELAKEFYAPEGDGAKEYTTLLSIFLIIGGLFGLYYGGEMIVDNAVILAKMFGMSERIIGLTIVAIGTSLPELATSVIAAYKNKADIAIGNIVGSNIFNTLWILGITATIMPMPISSSINSDVIFNVFVSILLLAAIIFFKKYTIARLEGSFFVILYIIYLLSVILGF